MYVDLYGLLGIVIFLVVVSIPDFKMAMRRNARRLASAAERLIAPTSFGGSPMQSDLIRYFEDRLCGDHAQRAERLNFYKDESRLLYAVMIVAYESLLFSDFKGTERHCSYRAKEQLKQVFISAANGLAERGYDPAEYTNKAGVNIQAVEQFCADYGMSFRLFD